MTRKEINDFIANYLEQYNGGSYEAYAEKEDIARACQNAIECADRTNLDRFSHWLFKNITHRVSNGIGSGLTINFDSYSDMVEDLRKAMEE